MHHGDVALVTGGTGFVGSALVRNLVSQGLKVVVLTLLTRAATRDAGGMSGVDRIRYDACTDEVATAVADVRPDYVFHLAAFGVNPGEDDLAAMQQASTTAPWAISRTRIGS